MLATSLTAALLGVEAHLVTVEADSAPGFPRFTMVGLADSALKESESRIRAALRNCGIPFQWDRRITVNLAPASLRKGGSSFDLATALGLLAADASLVLPQLQARAARRRARARRQPAPGAGGPADAAARPAPRARGGDRPGGVRARGGPGAGAAGLSGGAPWPRRSASCRPRSCLTRPPLRRLEPRERPRRRSTWPTCADRRSRGARSRSPPPADTTCCWSDLPAPARPCWRSGCPGSCLRSARPRPSRPPRSTRPPACPPRRRSRDRPFRSPAPLGDRPGAGRRRPASPRPGRSASLTTECFSSTSSRSSDAPRSRSCASPWRTATSPSSGTGGVPHAGAFSAGGGPQPLPLRLVRDQPGGLPLHAGRHPGLPRPAFGSPARSNRPARRRTGAELRRDRRPAGRIDRDRAEPGRGGSRPASRAGRRVANSSCSNAFLPSSALRRLVRPDADGERLAPACSRSPRALGAGPRPHPPGGTHDFGSR